MQLDFGSCVTYCNFDHLPKELEDKYQGYDPDLRRHLIPPGFLEDLFAQYPISEKALGRLKQGIGAIEADPVLFHFTKFLVHVMVQARNLCDEAFYTNMTPECMRQHGELYSFLLLLACAAPSIDRLKKRGVPESYYENTLHQPLHRQLEQLEQTGDPTVHDFPWLMNFYTFSIYRLDRFSFIPHRFSDELTIFRNRDTGEVIALSHAGLEFRGDGQRNGVNGVHDPEGTFVSQWQEDSQAITANRINPLGFAERDPVTVSKQEWEPVLRQGDMLLALHIPSGPGYTPDRLHTSMKMAIEFYNTYYPELPIQGFWSESWLYDPRLSLMLNPEKSHIVQVQRQFYNYPIPAGDTMIRYELFGDRNADPVGRPGEYTTSLQKAAAEYMRSGARFHTTSMIVLKEDVDNMGGMPYITEADIESFRRTVDSHLRRGELNV